MPTFPLTLRSCLIVPTVLVGLMACQDPTQIELQVSTDVPYAAGRSIAFTMGSVGQTETRAPNVVTDIHWGPDGKVGSLVVTPSGDTDEAVEVNVVMGIGRAPEECTIADSTNCIVTHRQLKFVPNRSLRLPIGLFALCEDVPCEESSTCNSLGTCVPKTLDAQGCAAQGGNACVVAGDEVLLEAIAPPQNTLCSSRPGGYVCRDSSGLCDPAETCDGITEACPRDALRPEGAVCRAEVPGGCDVADTCNGTSSVCPADEVEPLATVCREASDTNGWCDIAETCTGTSNTCPVDVRACSCATGSAPSGAICRAAVGDCDVAETCNGVESVCPLDSRRPIGHVCRAAVADGCDQQEICYFSKECAADVTCDNAVTCTDNIISAVGVVASSVTAPNDPTWAADGDPTTYWESAHGVDPSWIYIDLGATVYVDHVTFDWHTNAGDSYFVAVAGEGVCPDNGSACLSTDAPWNTLTVDPTQEAFVAEGSNTFGFRMPFRYLRVSGTARENASANTGYSLDEITVFGDSNGTCVPP